MPAIPHPYLLAAGIVLFLIGIWCWRWSSRHAIDLKGAAIGAAWQSATSRQIPDVPDDIKGKFTEIANQPSHVGKAKRAGGIAVRHFIAQVVWIASLIGLAGGLALAAAGILWK